MLLAFVLYCAERRTFCLVLYNLYNVTSQMPWHNWLHSHLLPIWYDWSPQGAWTCYIGIKKCYTSKILLYNILWNLQKLLYMTSQQGFQGYRRGYNLFYYFLLFNLIHKQNLLFNLLYCICYNGLDFFLYSMLQNLKIYRIYM